MKKLGIAILICAVTGATAFAKKPQPVAAGGPQVVDANGAVVGDLLQQSTVLMEVNGEPISAIVGRDGFLPNAPNPVFTTSDCTGTRYMLAGSLPEPAAIETANQQPAPIATLTYPASPIVVRHISSQLTSDGCNAVNANFPTGLATTTQVNFVVPFGIQ